MAAQEEDRTLIELGYPVVVDDAVREPLRAFLRDRGAPFVVLCDANVAGLADELTRRMPQRRALIAIRLGERRKRLAVVEQVLGELLAAGADRGTIVVGAGGGVASDLFGFAASIYMRGVPYVHVATSLVAMVDAAIGGKTGVDLAGGKNLSGTFRDPIAVFAHTGALRTLPYRHLREGLAEMIKHGIIEGGKVFESLETLAPHPFWRWPWESIVRDSIAVKAAIVHEDREERGARERLNLGHTFAHGIEGASSYAVSHGAAVSIGLRAAGLLALQKGLYSRDDHLRVLTLLALLRMPVQTAQRPALVYRAMQADKKKRDGVLRFVLPRTLGDVEFGIAARESAVMRVLERVTGVPGGAEFR